MRRKGARSQEPGDRSKRYGEILASPFFSPFLLFFFSPPPEN